MSLAALIIHELLHSTVFLKNHAQFSEELAEFVGTEGARLYIEKYGNQSIGNTGEERADRAAYIFFIQGLVSELDAVYKSGISREEKLARKEEIIKAAKARFDENYDSLFSSDSYRFFTGMSVNNAYLELYRLYHEEERYFRKLYESSGSDLRQFITAAKTLNKKPSKRDPREALEEALALK
jgi:predicted aminopeptidase